MLRLRRPSTNDYSEELGKAARSVLLELVHLLGEYWNHIVLIGGWVPELLVSSKESPHIGSNDVDLALDHLKLKDEGTSRLKNYCLTEDISLVKVLQFLSGR